jgi:hypothetical protein
MLASTPQARFSVEEQFSAGNGRAVVRWRYHWAGGHVRGVDIVRVRDGLLAESLAYVKGQRDDGGLVRRARRVSHIAWLAATTISFPRAPSFRTQGCRYCCGGTRP